MTENSEQLFNLIDEPWLLVEFSDGRVRETSIRSALSRAHELRRLHGDLPTQAFSQFRLLLALLRRAVDGPFTRSDWVRLWTDPELPKAVLDNYFNRWFNRFFLIHPTMPFYQVAGLEKPKVRPGLSSLAELVADLPTGVPTFTQRVITNGDGLTFSEASRWLLHVHDFDVAGIKGAAGGQEQSALNGKVYGSHVGWGGSIGAIVVEGSTLKETLLLNLIPQDVGLIDGGPDDLPPWEREPLGPSWEQRPPHGPIDLMTWQSRRVRLIRSGELITGCVLTSGDRFEERNLFRMEANTSWSRSTNQESKLGLSAVYLPRKFQAGTALWRSLNAILPWTQAPQQGSESASWLPPPVIEWVSSLVVDGILSDRAVMGTVAFGMTYGTQNAIIEDVIYDVLPLPLIALEPAAAAIAVNAVESAGKAIRTLGHLAENLARAGGGDGKGDREKALSAGWAAVDTPFRSWVAGLSSDSLDTASFDWEKLVRKIVENLGQFLIVTAGPGAFAGREIISNKSKYLMNSAIADLKFRSDLSHSLPTTTSNNSKTQENQL